MRGVTGTGVRPYIRPVGEGQRPSGLDAVRAYRPDRPSGFVSQPSAFAESRYAGLTCNVIVDHMAFALVDGSRLILVVRG
jgi:hypothetical protein